MSYFDIAKIFKRNARNGPVLPSAEPGKKVGLHDINIVLDLPESMCKQKSGKKQRKKKRRWKMCKLFRKFCNKTTLHGLRYVGDNNSHILIRCFWAAAFILSLSCATYNIYNLYDTWEKNPVLVTMNPKPTKIEEIPFPAVTICYPRDKPLLTEDTVMELQGNASLRNLVSEYCENGSFKKNDKRPEIAVFKRKTNLKCRHVHMTPPKQTKNVKNAPRVKKFQLQMRNKTLLCCTFNGLEPADSKDLETNGNRTVEPIKVKTLGVQEGMEIALKVNCSSESKFKPFQVAIHSPYELPDLGSQGLVAKMGHVTKFSVHPRVTRASDKLPELHPKYRECYFDQEMSLGSYTKYTQWNCMLDCLANETFKTCNCTPPYIKITKDRPSSCKNNNHSCFTELYFDFDSLCDGVHGSRYWHH